MQSHERQGKSLEKKEKEEECKHIKFSWARDRRGAAFRELHLERSRVVIEAYPPTTYVHIRIKNVVRRYSRKIVFSGVIFACSTRGTISDVTVYHAGAYIIRVPNRLYAIITRDSRVSSLCNEVHAYFYFFFLYANANSAYTSLLVEINIDLTYNRVRMHAACGQTISDGCESRDEIWSYRVGRVSIDKNIYVSRENAFLTARRVLFYVVGSLRVDNRNV